ncbi:MAG: flagellar hook-length control protein FliK [Clostridia bacterium]|nr:flagellar hook-length control protein FliK [Clostridia bacterium]
MMAVATMEKVAGAGIIPPLARSRGRYGEPVGDFGSLLAGLFQQAPGYMRAGHQESFPGAGRYDGAVSRGGEGDPTWTAPAAREEAPARTGVEAFRPAENMSEAADPAGHNSDEKDRPATAAPRDGAGQAATGEARKGDEKTDAAGAKVAAGAGQEQDAGRAGASGAGGGKKAAGQVEETGAAGRGKAAGAAASAKTGPGTGKQGAAAGPDGKTGTADTRAATAAGREMSPLAAGGKDAAAGQAGSGAGLPGTAGAGGKSPAAAGPSGQQPGPGEATAAGATSRDGAGSGAAAAGSAPAPGEPAGAVSAGASTGLAAPVKPGPEKVAPGPEGVRVAAIKAGNGKEGSPVTGGKTGPIGPGLPAGDAGPGLAAREGPLTGPLNAGSGAMTAALQAGVPHGGGQQAPGNHQGGRPVWPGSVPEVSSSHGPLLGGQVSFTTALSGGNGQLAGGPAGSVNNLPEVVANVMLAARLSRTGSQRELELQLQPESLGTMKLRATLEGGRLGLHLLVETSEAARALQAAVPEMRQAVAQQGLRLDQVQVQVGGDGQAGDNQHDGQGGYHRGSGRQPQSPLWPEAAVTREATGNYRLNYLA